MRGGLPPIFGSEVLALKSSVTNQCSGTARRRPHFVPSGRAVKISAPREPCVFLVCSALTLSIVDAGRHVDFGYRRRNRRAAT